MICPREENINQMVMCKIIHASNIISTEQVVSRNITVCLCVCACVMIMEKKAINLKESKEVYMEGFGGRKGNVKTIIML